MTIPEQLATWREKFEKEESPSHLERMPNGMYMVIAISNRWRGYLRRCQENEQAIKDARKQALEEAIAILDDNKTNSTGAHITLNALRELLK